MLNAKNDLRSPFFTPQKPTLQPRIVVLAPTCVRERHAEVRTRAREVGNLSSTDGMRSCNLSQENSSLKLVYSILSTPFPSNPAGRTGARLAFLDGHLGRWSPAGRRRRDFGQATSEVTQTRTRGYDHPKTCRIAGREGDPVSESYGRAGFGEVTIGKMADGVRQSVSNREIPVTMPPRFQVSHCTRR